MKACICWLSADLIPLSAQVSYDRIAASAAEPGSWLTYSGNYSAHRYSPLKQIDRDQRRAG